MQPRPAPRPTSASNWKELYNAALFENDRASLQKRMAAAKAAIEAERKKLMISAYDIRDIAHQCQVLDNALFSLQALASCMAVQVEPVPASTMQVRAA